MPFDEASFFNCTHRPNLSISDHETELTNEAGKIERLFVMAEITLLVKGCCSVSLVGEQVQNALRTGLMRAKLVRRF